jgi:uncharacterized membrane protein
LDVIGIVLRIVHIAGGVAWVGGAAMFFFYLEPTINKLGPDAEKFVDEVINRRKAPIYFAATSTLTVIAGIVLYWRDFGRIDTTSSFGVALGLGGIAGLIAWLGGNLLIPRTLTKVAAIITEVKAGDGPPSNEQAARLHAAQHRLRLIGLVDIALLAFAVVAMASARYLG